ncbi:MAG: 3-deoxy-manno-octulosonate cytidylyltransferase [Steroidobacteraceae bacterium]
MKVLALIPARMGSSRFPGKPMASLLGKPMIGHVYDRVRQAEGLDAAAVATCDPEIRDYIASIGGTAVMTDSAHERASDRCAEALLSIERQRNLRYDIVVMVQGDEPMTHPQMIVEAVEPFAHDNDLKVVNLMAPIKTLEEFEDRNCIKVVCDLRGNAIYFSREPIPHRLRSGKVVISKQVCVIPFRRDFLLEYARMAPTPLEIAESIDMLRVLEHGGRVRMVPTMHESHAVDTPADLRKVEELMKLNIAE